MSEYDLSTGDVSMETEKTQTEGIDYIEYNGEKFEDFIECSDGKQVPAINERIPAAEEYAFRCMLQYKLGRKVGNSDMTSTVMDSDDSRFPNRAIGQTADDPTPKLKDAVSPGHFWYAMKGKGDKKSEAQSECHAAIEEVTGHKFNLEVYKRNFPVRVVPDDMDTEMVTVEESQEGKGEWENFQVPPSFEEEYGGLPPVLEEMPEEEPESDSDGDTLEIPDDFGAGMNKGEHIKALLNEFEALRNIPRDTCIDILRNETDASVSYTNTKYNEFMTQDTVTVEIYAQYEDDVKGYKA